MIKYVVRNFSLSKYLLLLFPVAIVVPLLWSILIDGNLYYCSDKVPFLDFKPPFVHTSLYGGSTGDYFIVSPAVVWIMWILFVIAIFMIPYFIVKKFKLSSN